MLTAAGYPPPPPTGDEQADNMGLTLMLLEFAVVEKVATPEELKSESPEVAKRICDALIAKTGGKVVPKNGNGWWSRQPTGTKIAIGVGGVAVVGLAAYLVLK